MPELTSIPAGELAALKERLNRLAREKAQLQLIALLTNRMTELPGLEKTVEGMLQFVMDILGGQNATIFYRLDDVIHCVDAQGRKEIVGEIDDELTRQVFATGEVASQQRDFSHTGMLTKEFTKATTWAMPLRVGAELVGVLRMDDLLVAHRELRDEVQTFLRYASLLLKNEISGESRLRRAFAEVRQANRELTVEVVERRRAEAELQRAKDQLERRVADRTAELRGIIEGTTSPIFSVDREYRYVAFNQGHAATMRALYGTEVEIGGSLLDGMPGEDREIAKRNLDRALAGEHLVESAYSGSEPRTRRIFKVSHHPILGEGGQVIGAAVFAEDVTERERAEEERRASLRFFESMDHVNRAMQRTSDLEQMMSDVLDAVLSDFQCDRAWLVYPCDPETASYRVPMERTRPEFPGALERGLEVPLDPETARVLEAARRSSGPVTFGPGTEPPLPTYLTEQFQVQSQIIMALHPKGATPYAFGLHQCSSPRVWTAEEKSLFQAIGWRLADGLTSLLAHRDLQKSEERYRRIVDTAAEGIWVLGPTGETTFVNARMAEMLGRSTEQMIGRPVLDFMFEEDTADHATKMENRRCGRSETYERRFRRKDGETVWTIASGTPVFDGEHRFGGSFAMFTDVTERRRAEAALRESEERYRLIAENTADTITILGFDFRFVYVSPSVLKLRGFSAEETMGQSLDEVFTPDSLAKVMALYAEQMALEASGTADPSRTESLELEEYCKNGSTIWVEVALSFLRDASHQPTGILAVTRDITRRRAGEAELVESEQRYRSLADSSPDNIIRYDVEGRLVYVNRNMDKTVGLELRSRIGMTHLESVTFPGIDSYRATLQQVILSGQPDEVEIIVPSPTGEMRTHHVRFVAERSNEGEIIGALAFGRDVTERKEAARERQEYLSKLRHNLEETVSAIAATVEARDPYTAGHQRRVADLGAAIARELGLEEEAVQGIHLAGTIHDLGKIKIPAEILARPGLLSEIETRLIQIHPEAGWEILKGVEFPWPIAQMVLEHHERLNGTGYPKNLKGDQISLGARILAVADVVEAMASHRPYRPSRGLELSLAEIERDRDTLYDADVVDACLRLFRAKGYRFPD